MKRFPELTMRRRRIDAAPDFDRHHRQLSTATRGQSTRALVKRFLTIVH
jgi:hypothetical protein